MWHKAKAPGSLMLLGEYAVLHDYPALVSAIDRHLTVAIRKRADTKVTITSAMGTLSLEKSQLTIEPPFQFVLAVLSEHLSQFSFGLDIEIQSEMLPTLGFGSSAATTVATLAALWHLLGRSFSSQDLIRAGRAIVRSVQHGVGSGADIAASVLGGIVHYQQTSLVHERFAIMLPLLVYYSGYKTKTAVAIQKVKARFEASPDEIQLILTHIAHCVAVGFHALKAGDLRSLGDAMNAQQALLAELQVSTADLDEIVSHLRKIPGVLGAKISGAGLGDSVIALLSEEASLVSPADFKLPRDATRTPCLFLPPSFKTNETIAMTLEGVHVE